MSSVAAELIVDVKGREVGLSALLARIQAQLAQTNASGQQTTNVFGGALPSSMQRSTNAALSLQQAQARLEATQGNVAGAAQRLTNALAQQDATTVQTINAERQLLNLQNQLSGSTGGLSSQLGGLTSALGAVGIGLGAAQLLRGAADLTQLGAQAQQTAARFDQLAAQAHTTGDAMLVSLRQSSAGTISDTNLQLAAMKANLLGVATSAEQLGPLLAIARDRAQQMGISTAFAFDSLVTGLGRGSRLILDNIGVMVKEGEVNEAYAKSVGKTVAQLTDQEKKQALVNEVLRQGQATMAQTGGAIESNAVKLERLNADWDNLKAKAGGALANVVGGAADGAVKVTSLGERLTQLNGAVVVGATSYADYTRRVQFANQELSKLNVLLGILPGTSAGAVAPLTADQFRYAQSLISTGVAADQAAVRARNMGVDIIAGGVAAATAAAAHVQAAAASRQLGAAMDVERTAIANATAARQLDSAAMDVERQQAALVSDAMINLANANNVNTNALVDQIAKSLTSAIQGQQLAQVQQTLASLGSAVAGGLQTAGNAALVLANQYGIAYGAALNLINAQAQLAHAQVAAKALDAQRTEERGALPSDELASRTRANEAAERLHQQFLASEHTRTRAAGGVKLSDQAKLNNTLLGDQEKYQDQAEAAEREHLKKVLDIEAEFQKKSLEQQRANEVSKRQSRADFYDSLTSATKDVGKGVATELSAAYEQAYAKAQGIAQAGNQKLADDYLKLKQGQIKDELDFQKNLAEARKSKDSAEVARLQAIHKLRQDAAAEEEKQLLAGGDPNVKARDEAQQAEAARFADQQDKNATAADNAAQRKIDAAARSGKAIDAENLKLQEQERILNRIGPRQPGGAQAMPTAPGTPPTPVIAPTGPTDLAALADALRSAADQITAAIDGARTAIVGAQRDTTGAVKGLDGRALG